MDNQRLLHILSAKDGGAAALYVNGIEKESGGKELKRIVDLSFHAGRYQTPWCGTVEGYFFVKGHFENKDYRGKEMSFSYCSKKACMRDNIDSFFKEIDELGYKVNAGTKACLDHVSYHNNLLIIGIAAISLVIIVILLLLLKK